LGFFVIALLWASSMIVAIFRTRDSEMPLDDLDFAVLFGSAENVLNARPLIVQIRSFMGPISPAMKLF
jgi:hypothetical protein